MSRKFTWIAAAVMVELAPDASIAQLQSTPPPAFNAQVKQGRVEVAPLASVTRDQRMASEVVRMRALMETRGYLDAPSARAAVIDGYYEDDRVRSRLKPSMAEVMGELRVSPTDLENTLLRNAQVVGVTPAGGFVGSGWTGVARVMTVPGLGRVVLEEFDYVAAGSYILVPQELVDSTINGLPSQFSVWRAPEGKSWTEFRWFTSNKEFRLYIGREIRKTDKIYQSLQELALRAQ